MHKHKKTGYEWCVEDNVRVLDVENWPRRYEQSADKGYYLTSITREEFLKYLTNCKIKVDSTPRKSEWFLELRMYSLVPYNIMPIQKGIQHEHSVVDHVVRHVLDEIAKGNAPDEKFVTWAREWKTSMLLNGGTSNEGNWVRHGFREIWYVGTMQGHLETLQTNNIPLSFFKEPDLNSMLTGISFIVDERVFNKDLYPKFVSDPYPWKDKKRGYMPSVKEFEEWEKSNNKNYEAWVEKIGGEKNAFLREFLGNFRLA